LQRFVVFQTTNGRRSAENASNRAGIFSPVFMWCSASETVAVPHSNFVQPIINRLH
jgi:hypothetical protein